MNISPNIDLHKIKTIHFIGIGGISMSGLAEIMLHLGYSVSGSDVLSSDTTKKLQSKGIKVYISHNENNIQKPDLVVFTAAVKEDNPELLRARELNIPVMDRARLLGLTMKMYPFSIAVSGTHGKTTTTSMISTVMLESNLDPTIHIGGVLNRIEGSTKIGGNKFFVAESCEYVESFLKFFPYLAVVLNIDLDHLDYFKDIEHVKASFLKFISKVPSDGFVIACVDDDNVSSILSDLKCNTVTYSTNDKKADWKASNIVFNSAGHGTFTLLHNEKEVGEISLSVPGLHNISNALACIATCHIAGCSIENIQKGLASFTGTHRRFEFKGELNNITVIDDYAHHPTEIQATLKAAKNTTFSNIWCVFQPHTYTRTHMLLNDFGNSFINADKVIITDIYAAREGNTLNIHSNTLVEKIKENNTDVIYISDFNEISDYLHKNAKPGDLILTMGAGDIHKVGNMFLDSTI